MAQCETALQAAQKYGGWDWTCVDISITTAADVREYFSAENFAQMFPGEDYDDIGGFTPEECESAVLEELEQRQCIEADARRDAARILSGREPMSYSDAGYVTALEAAEVLVGTGSGATWDRTVEIVAEALEGEEVTREEGGDNV